MDTKKFEYLETIRETIETGDYEELDEYVEDIRDRVKYDPDFNELFAEIKSRKYSDVIHLIDEFIYKDMQCHFGSNDEEVIQNHLNGLGLDPELPEDISFEEFHEEDFSSVSSQDDDF